MRRSNRNWVSLIVCFAIATVVRADDRIPDRIKPENLLANGDYQLIEAPNKDDAHAYAVWAFAQYYLGPSRSGAKSAQFAHEHGDAMGTFILILCRRNGSGMLRDPKEANRLNYQLRTRLEKVESPSAIELFMLSQCHEGDENGQVNIADPKKMYEEVYRQRALAVERLRSSADQGFAQAWQEAALDLNDPAGALKWHEKAARCGLPEGWRDQGTQLINQFNDEDHRKMGFVCTKCAAELKDAISMVNLAACYHHGIGVNKNDAEARKWLDAAAASGHWCGELEKGLAFLRGNYGIKVDEKEGLRYLQRAVESGYGEALHSVATAFLKSTGLKKNGKRAIEFAEAAYRQGRFEAASVLAEIYTQGTDDVKADKVLGEFWSKEARQPGLGISTLNEKERAVFLKRIEAIDPFELKVK
jgi:TPR repeat protein